MLTGPVLSFAKGTLCLRGDCVRVVPVLSFADDTMGSGGDCVLIVPGLFANCGE